MNHLDPDEVIKELHELLNSREGGNKCLDYREELKSLEHLAS